MSWTEIDNNPPPRYNTRPKIKSRGCGSSDHNPNAKRKASRVRETGGRGTRSGDLCVITYGRPPSAPIRLVYPGYNL